MKSPKKRRKNSLWYCPNPVIIRVPVLDSVPQHFQISRPFITESLASKVRSLAKLPHSALVHFWGRVRQMVIVSAPVQWQWGKRRTRAEHFWRDAVQGPWDAGLWAGRIPWVVGHDIGETLHLSGGMVARERVVHTSKGVACGAWGWHKGEINWGLGLWWWWPLREKVIVPCWTIVFTLIICRCKRSRKKISPLAQTENNGFAEVIPGMLRNSLNIYT